MDNALEAGQKYQFGTAEDALTDVREGDDAPLQYKFGTAEDALPPPSSSDTQPPEVAPEPDVVPESQPEAAPPPEVLPEEPLVEPQPTPEVSTQEPLTVDQTGSLPSVPDIEPLQSMGAVAPGASPDPYEEQLKKLKQREVEILEEFQQLRQEVVTGADSFTSTKPAEEDSESLVNIRVLENRNDLFSNPAQGFEPPNIWRETIPGTFGRYDAASVELPKSERVGYRYADNWLEASYLRQRPDTTVEIEAEKAGTFLYDRYQALENIIPGFENAVSSVNKFRNNFFRTLDSLYEGYLTGTAYLNSGTNLGDSVESDTFENFGETFLNLEEARYSVNSGLLRGFLLAPFRLLGSMYGLTMGGIADGQLAIARNNLVSKDNVSFSGNMATGYIANTINAGSRDVFVTTERYQQMLEELVAAQPERRKEFAGTLRRLEAFNRLNQPSLVSEGHTFRPNVAANLFTFGTLLSNVGTNYDLDTGDRFSLGVYGSASNPFAGTSWGFRLYDPVDMLKGTPSNWFTGIGYSYLTAFGQLALEIVSNPIELFDLGTDIISSGARVATRKNLSSIASRIDGVEQINPVFLTNQDRINLETVADNLDNFADSLPTRPRPSWSNRDEVFDITKLTTPDYTDERIIAREMASALRKKAEEVTELLNKPAAAERASYQSRPYRQDVAEQSRARARQFADEFNRQNAPSSPVRSTAVRQAGTDTKPLVQWEDAQIDLTEGEAWGAWGDYITRAQNNVPPSLTDEETFLLDQVTGLGSLDELEVKSPRQLYNDYLDNKVAQFRQSVDQAPVNTVEPSLDPSVQADIAKMRQLGDDVIEKFNNRVAEIYEEEASRIVAAVEAERAETAIEQANRVYQQVLDELELEQYKLPETELDALLPQAAPEQLLLPGTEEASQVQIPGFIPKGLLTGSDLDTAVKLDELMTGDEYLNKFYSDLLDEPPDGDAYLDQFYSDLFEPLTELQNPTVAQSLDAVSTVADDVSDVLEVLDELADNTALAVLSDVINQYAPGGEQALSDAINNLVDSLPPSTTESALSIVDNLSVENQRISDFLDNMTADVLADNLVTTARISDGLTGLSEELDLDVRGLSSIVAELRGKSRESLETAAQYLSGLREALQAQKVQIGEMLDEAIVTVGRNMDEAGLQRLAVMANELGIFDIGRFNDSVLEWLDSVYANLGIADIVREGAWIPPQFIDNTGRVRPSRVAQEFNILNQLPPVKVIVPPSLPDFSLEQLQNLANYIIGKAQIKGKKKGVTRQEYVRRFETGTVVTPLNKTFSSIAEARVAFADYIRDVLKTADNYRVGSFSNMGQARDILLQAAKWLGVENARYAGFYRLRTELDDMLRQLDRTIPTLDITEATRIDVNRTSALNAAGRLGQPPIEVVPKTYDNLFRLADEIGASTDDISQAALTVFDQAKEYARMLQAGEFKNKNELYDAVTSLGQYATKGMKRAELEQALQTALEPYSWYFEDPVTIYVPSKVGSSLDDVRTAHGAVTGYVDRQTAELAAQSFDSSLPIDAPIEYTVLEVQNYRGRRISPNKWDIDTADVINSIPVSELDNTVAAKYAKVQAAMQSYSDVKQPFTDLANQLSFELGYEADEAARQVFITAAREYTERLDSIRQAFDEVEEFTFTRHSRQLKAAAEAPRRTNAVDLATYIDLERRKVAAMEAGDFTEASRIQEELSDRRSISGHNDYTSGTMGGNC